MHGVLNFLNKEEKNNLKNYAWGPLDHPHYCSKYQLE